MTTTPPDARNALAEIVAQIEWLKSRLAYLQLPANSQKSIDEWLSECGMPAAGIAALEAQVEGMRVALERLTRDAGEVSRLGAVTGRQWTLLAGSLILSRAALQTSETTGV